MKYKIFDNLKLKIEKNCEYYILFLSDNSQYQKRTTINFYFYFSNEKEIFILDEKNKIYFN